MQWRVAVLIICGAAEISTNVGGISIYTQSTSSCDKAPEGDRAEVYT
jgi:hypothetical protein